MKKTIFSLIAILTIAFASAQQPSICDNQYVHFSTANVDNDYTFTNHTMLDLTSDYTVSYIWLISDNTTNSTDQQVFNHTFAGAGTYIVTLLMQISQGNSVICSKAINDTINILSTGISELKQGTAQISAYNKQITVSSETDIKQVQVFNITGQLVVDLKTNSNRANFSLSELTNGIYIVSVTDANNELTNKKLLIQ